MSSNTIFVAILIAVFLCMIVVHVIMHAMFCSVSRCTNNYIMSNAYIVCMFCSPRTLRLSARLFLIQLKPLSSISFDWILLKGLSLLCQIITVMLISSSQSLRCTSHMAVQIQVHVQHFLDYANITT